MLSDHFEEETILKGGESSLDETRCEEVLIKKVFHLTHKENQGSIKKSWDAVTPRLDAVKLWFERSQEQRKK